jgi:hypothetical protein
MTHHGKTEDNISKHVSYFRKFETKQIMYISTILCDETHGFKIVFKTSVHGVEINTNFILNGRL